MSMMICEKCHRMVSKNSFICPECGSYFYTNLRSNDNSFGRTIVILSIIGLLVSAAILCLGFCGIGGIL